MSGQSGEQKMERGGLARGSRARGGQAPWRGGRLRAAATRVPATCTPPPVPARARVAVPGIDNWEVNLRSVARCYAQGLPRGVCARLLNPFPATSGSPPPQRRLPRTRSLRPLGPGIPMGARHGGDFGDGGAQAAPRGAAPHGLGSEGCQQPVPTLQQLALLWGN